MASDHALRLGKLLGNLQSLEVLLRVYLLKVGAGATAGHVTKKPYWDLVVGEIVDDDEFSNYDTLGQLVAIADPIRSPHLADPVLIGVECPFSNRAGQV